jgi:hypothetical protein
LPGLNAELRPDILVIRLRDDGGVSSVYLARAWPFVGTTEPR